MSHVLIVFPHGTGDAVMATPSLRALRRANPTCKIDIAVQPIVANSGILENCPYLDNIYTVDNPYFAPSLEEGNEILKKQIAGLVEFFGHGDVKWVLHRQQPENVVHKVFLTAEEIGVELNEDTRYEVFVGEREEAEACALLADRGLEPGSYAFVHSFSSDRRKNVSLREAKKLLPADLRNRIISIDKTFDVARHPIGVAISLLRFARFLVLVDSVFVHCADALGKDIDIHITNPDLLEANRPLHVKTVHVLNQPFTRHGALMHKAESAGVRARASLETLLHNQQRRRRVASIDFSNWFSTIIEPGYRSHSMVGIVCLILKRRVGQYFIRMPYLAYLQPKGEYWHMVNFEVADPIPIQGIQLLESNGTTSRDIRSFVGELRLGIKSLLNSGEQDPSAWISIYSSERLDFVESRIVSAKSLLGEGTVQQAFASDADVANFFNSLSGAIRG